MLSGVRSAINFLKKKYFPLNHWINLNQALSESLLGYLLSILFPVIPSIFNQHGKGPGGLLGQVVGLPNNSYKPIINTAWVRARFCELQEGCTRLAVTSDKVYQLLVHGRWFSPGTPASSTTKTGRHGIAEILPKVALNTINQIIKSTNMAIVAVNRTNVSSTKF